LVATPNNQLQTLFPQTINGYVPGSGQSPWFGATVSIFSGGTYSGAGKLDGISYSGGWNSGGTITLNPGQACFFYNPAGATLTNTIVGTVPQNGQYNMTNTLIAGYNMVGSIVPVTGSFISPIVNLTNSIGQFDTVTFWSGTSWENPAQGSYSLGWGGGAGVHGEPTLPSVTQGFFYYNATAGGPTGGYAETSSNEFWVENFTVNP
jgi:hypothetical protein